MTILGLILPDSPMCPHHGVVPLGGPCVVCGVPEGSIQHRQIPARMASTAKPAELRDTPAPLVAFPMNNETWREAVLDGCEEMSLEEMIELIKMLGVDDEEK